MLFRSLELSLRNIIDFALKLTLGNEWLQTLKQQYMQKDKSKTSFEERLLLEISKIENKYTKCSKPLPKRDQYISNLSLGFWVKIADEFKICSILFNPSLLDFRNYGGSYNNRDISKAQKHWKIIYAMNLLLIIRNKAYHWENLLKLNANNNPNITYQNNKNYKLIASITPNKINKFLEDFLKTINSKLMRYL